VVDFATGGGIPVAVAAFRSCKLVVSAHHCCSKTKKQAKIEVIVSALFAASVFWIYRVGMLDT
jgi:hypothetical protein